MRSHRNRKAASVLDSAAFVIAAVGMLVAGLVYGAVLLIQSTVRSALLVDSLPTENTVRTVELGAAEDGMLIGLAIIIACAALTTVLLVAASRRRARSRI
ncbi:hypothetical protein C5C13_02590 [Clavibacter michiganensis]|nr:hypothetical protein C5C13_02590 [Clavibacter michiganensis]